jgi:hypothetical protein
VRRVGVGTATYGFGIERAEAGGWRRHSAGESPVSVESEVVSVSAGGSLDVSGGGVDPPTWERSPSHAFWSLSKK